MKQNLLILDVNPFGALTDSVKWVEYLKDEWNITMICFTTKGGAKTKGVGFKLIQLKNFKRRQIKALWFFVYTIVYIAFFRGKIVVEYFPFCDIYKKLFPWKRMLVDIRTLSVSSDANVRKLHNEKLVKSCTYYDKVTAISEGVAKQMGLPNISILPLGADTISTINKTFTDAICLLYVGTFTNRHIDYTIEGVVAFHQEHPEISIVYNIIGYGVDGEAKMFEQMINEHDASGYIKLKGRLSHSELRPYFDQSNVGLSFVPITNYYNDQPPTKTYEYCLSGIYCIATATTINKNLIKAQNGVLIEDSAKNVKEGLEYFWKNRKTLCSTEIRKTLCNCTWKKIANDTFSPILKSL